MNRNRIMVVVGIAVLLALLASVGAYKFLSGKAGWRSSPGSRPWGSSSRWSTSLSAQRSTRTRWRSPPGRKTTTPRMPSST